MMTLEKGQQFTAVITGTIRGKRFFSPITLVSTCQQSPKYAVGEMMGIPIQESVQAKMLNDEETTSYLVLRGSINTIEP